MGTCRVGRARMFLCFFLNVFSYPELVGGLH